MRKQIINFIEAYTNYNASVESINEIFDSYEALDEIPDFTKEEVLSICSVLQDDDLEEMAGMLSEMIISKYNNWPLPEIFSFINPSDAIVELKCFNFNEMPYTTSTGNVLYKNTFENDLYAVQSIYTIEDFKFIIVIISLIGLDEPSFYKSHLYTKISKLFNDFVNNNNLPINHLSRDELLYLKDFGIYNYPPNLSAPKFKLNHIKNLLYEPIEVSKNEFLEVSSTRSIDTSKFNDTVFDVKTQGKNFHLNIAWGYDTIQECIGESNEEVRICYTKILDTRPFVDLNAYIVNQDDARLAFSIFEYKRILVSATLYEILDPEEPEFFLYFQVSEYHKTASKTVF